MNSILLNKVIESICDYTTLLKAENERKEIEFAEHINRLGDRIFKYEQDLLAMRIDAKTKDDSFCDTSKRVEELTEQTEFLYKILGIKNTEIDELSHKYQELLASTRITREPTLEEFLSQSVIPQLSDAPVDDLSTADTVSTSTSTVFSDGDNLLEFVMSAIQANKTLKKSTTSSYRHHLKSLKSLDEADIKAWVDSSTCASYAKIRTCIANTLSTRLSLGVKVTEPDTSKLPRNLKPKVEYTDRYEEWLSKPKLVDVTLLNLFAYFLPTRRRDIFSLIVVETLSDINDTDINMKNYFVKDKMQFIFNSYKTYGTYGQQRFDMNDYTYFINDEVKPKVLHFLANLPIGRMYSQSEDYLVKQIKRDTDYNLQEHRHMWSLFGNKTLDQETHRKLAIMMAHSYETNQSIYRP